MNDLERREYNSVVLGALLHDIGKLLHRGEGAYQGSHEEASFKFITKHSDNLKNEKLYDIDLVELLVKHHDPKKSPKKKVFQEPYLSNKSSQEREKVWHLVKMVRRADSYSCAERDHRQKWKGGTKTAPLDSIFTNIHLTPVASQDKNQARYHIAPIHPREAFPDSIEVLPKNELNDIILTLESNLPVFGTLNNFEKVLNIWLDLLEEYTWSVPSDTRYEFSDVSLFDHLSSSAAIAACLYKRELLWPNEIKMDRKLEFILIGGDFSGIQNYIFDITNRGSGGASKRLRARSLFIYAFSETVIHRFLHSLDLPAPCKLFSAGGKFLLLAPLVPMVKEVLVELKREVESYIHENYFSQFSFLMSWMEINGFRERMGTYTFFEIAEDMFHSLEIEKQQKAKEVLVNPQTGLWETSAFMAKELYNKYNASGDCRICGKGPALKTEERGDDEKEDIKCCDTCYRDKYLIGEILPKSRYLAFGLAPSGAIKKPKQIVTLCFKEKGRSEKTCYYFELFKDYKPCERHYLVLNITPEIDSRATCRKIGITSKYVANHVPVNEEGKIQPFDKIADISERKENGAIRGMSMLGVLKADIDNLGLIFSKGFEYPTAQEQADLKPVDRKTVSRFLTLSRMVELFQSGWVQDVIMTGSIGNLIGELAKFDKIIDKERLESYVNQISPDFKNIYVVYSGGDDMVLVGPWETMILFAFYLNACFHKYTCNNSITMSAGLTFVKPKHPIASAIRKADKLLHLSKMNGKDCITLFNRTISWGRLPELISYFLFLNEKINDSNSRINLGFLHRLLTYHAIAVSYIEEGKVDGLRFAPLLSYDIARNIVRRERLDIESRVISGREEYSELIKLINRKPAKKSLLHELDIPVRWAYCTNRGSKKQ